MYCFFEGGIPVRGETWPQSAGSLEDPQIVTRSQALGDLVLG